MSTPEQTPLPDLDRVRRWVLLASIVPLAFVGVTVHENIQFAARNHNESMTIATLKNIHSAQSQCQASGMLDGNHNDRGEYGYFRALSAEGHVDYRGQPQPPVLSSAFADIVEGCVERSGYLFQMFLPDAEGRGISELAAERGGDAMVSPRESEVLWCCYAWPVKQGRTGNRVFFINQAGDVLSTNGAVRPYSGRNARCDWWSAYAASNVVRSMAAKVAANTIAFDGNPWVVLS